MKNKDGLCGGPLTGELAGNAGHHEAPRDPGAENSKQPHPSHGINAVHLNFTVLQLHVYPICEFVLVLWLFKGCEHKASIIPSLIFAHI